MRSFTIILVTSHQFTPYELVFAYPARIPSSEPVKKLELLPTNNGYLEKLINNMREISAAAKQKLIMSKEKSRYQYQGPFDNIKVNENNNKPPRVLVN